MDIDPGIALSTAFTAPPVWAAIIQGGIQVLKSVPQFAKVLDGREKLTCFIAALAVVILAFWAGMSVVPPERSLDAFGIVMAVMAWFTNARLSMALYDDFIGRQSFSPEKMSDVGGLKTESVLNPIGWTGPRKPDEPLPPDPMPLVEAPVVAPKKPAARKPAAKPVAKPRAPKKPPA